MSLNQLVDRARNNLKPIYINELLEYSSKPNSKVRVFIKDRETKCYFGRDGFISFAYHNFCVEFDFRSQGEEPYKLKHDDTIGIPNGSGFEARKVVLDYKP